MSAIPFTRSLGARSGVQLNYIKDASERFVGGDSAQAFAGIGRFSRGRIDRAFPVDRDQMRRLLGAPASPAINALNEAQVQVYEAFQNGAVRAVIARCSGADSVLNWMVATNPAAPEQAVWSVAEGGTDPAGSYLLAIKHFECFSDGVTAEIHAVAEDNEGVPAPGKVVRLRLIDSGGQELFNITGSLDPMAKDEFGESTYLPSVASTLTDDLEIMVHPSATSVPVDAPFYGVDDEGRDKVSSAALSYYVEGDSSYLPADYDRAIDQLRNSQYPFRYIAGLGTKSTVLIGKLGALGPLINKNVVLDVPGNLSHDAAVTFANQFNFDTHYVHWYWAPLRALDPLNGGKLVFGTSGAQIGLRCRRNAQTDANGVPPMNYPVAGKSAALARTGIVQIATPGDEGLEKLAKARINPVIFQTYNSGGLYVFYDSLTAAKTEADRKLIAVAEMSSQVDDWVTAAVKEYLQLPISDTIKRTTDFLRQLFEGLEAAKWLIPSADLEGRSFIATVQPNKQRPKDRVDVSYWLSYDGTTRAIHVQQTISK